MPTLSIDLRPYSATKPRKTDRDTSARAEQLASYLARKASHLPAAMWAEVSHNPKKESKKP